MPSRSYAGIRICPDLLQNTTAMMQTDKNAKPQAKCVLWAKLSNSILSKRSGTVPQPSSASSWRDHRWDRRAWRVQGQYRGGQLVKVTP